jgi:hypothetical protein
MLLLSNIPDITWSKDDLKKRIITTALIVVIALSALGFGVFLLSQDSIEDTGFIFERAVTSSTPNRIFFQIRAEDTNISIIFDNRADLLYSIDVTPHPDSAEARIRIDTNDDSWGVDLSASRQKSVDITLGSGCFYFINMVDISNLNTTIVYSNRAWLNGSAFRYSDESSDLTLQIHDDIRVTDTIGFEGDITCETLHLDIDVPHQWNAFVDFHDSNLTIEEMTGWIALLGDYGYRTDKVHDGMPEIDIDVYAGEAFARLIA